MLTLEQLPFNKLQIKRLICRLFLKNNFIYRNIFKRKLYLPEDSIIVKLKVVNFSSCYFPYLIYAYTNLFMYVCLSKNIYIKPCVWTKSFFSHLVLANSVSKRTFNL